MSKGKDEGISEVSELEDEPETDTSKDKESNECSGNNDNNGAKTEDETSTSENKESNGCIFQQIRNQYSCRQCHSNVHFVKIFPYSTAQRNCIP